MRTNKKKKKKNFHYISRTNTFLRKILRSSFCKKQLTERYQKQMFRKREIGIAKFIIVLSIIVNYPRWFLDVSVSYRSECVSRTDKHSVQRMYLRSDVLSSFFCGLLIIPPVSESCRKQICSYACSDGSCPISDLFV